MKDLIEKLKTTSDKNFCLKEHNELSFSIVFKSTKTHLASISNIERMSDWAKENGYSICIRLDFENEISVDFFKLQHKKKEFTEEQLVLIRDLMAEHLENLIDADNTSSAEEVLYIINVLQNKLFCDEFDSLDIYKRNTSNNWGCIEIDGER